MTPFTSDYTAINGIIGVDEAIRLQREKLNYLREDVRSLVFKRIDMAGEYASISYKAIDGGKMKINFNPFEINVIDVADSNGNKKLSFVVPEISSYGDNTEEAVKDMILRKIDTIPVIQKFARMLNATSISQLSYILTDSNRLMDIAEWACIFERVTVDSDEPIIILKDGLLRTKTLKSNESTNYIKALKDILKAKKRYVKLVGVSKTSAVLSLLSTALFLEKKFPQDSIGYVKIPLVLELKAYEWWGRGKAEGATQHPLAYAFGELYIAKLAKNSNLLVTIEIPRDLENNQAIYSEEEIQEILSYLAKDSKFSYPVLGYPQTIMRAHETAVRLGFPASLIRDEIRDKIMESLDNDSKDFIRDGWLLIDFVDKGNLGGGGYS
jgi:hypothetical protein